MPVCKYCGFDSSEESIHAEGAPCGVDGCLVFSCCNGSWKDHCRIAHKKYAREELKLENVPEGGDYQR